MGRSRSGIKLTYLPLLLAFLCLLAYTFCLPKQLFKEPVSTILLAEDESLLGARMAGDEQWRFPMLDQVPEKFEKCIIQFEDRYFYLHPGINPVSLYKALRRNLSSGRVVNGGSTISMQVIRLSRKNKPRTYIEKVREIILATRLELRYSKAEILCLYASYAPFGGNIIGLDAAAWRYYGRQADQLSWGESATLAVLPNSPALIFPGRNADKLLAKRNRLLSSLQRKGILSESECRLASLEPLPEKAFSIPHLADHLLNRAMKEFPEQKRLHTSLNSSLQQQMTDLAAQHYRMLRANEIQNLAVLVVEVPTGKVVGYLGNVSGFDENADGKDVDIITSARSTGSILKPLLYAAMLNAGKLLPNTLVKDVPVFFGSFHPQNYNRDFDGAVQARRVVARSLNVPSVIMLKEFSVARFYDLLKKLGIKSLNKPPSHYGLSLILGGAEASLWDLAGIYTGLSRVMMNYSANSSRYNHADYYPPYYLNETGERNKNHQLQRSFPLSASSVYFMLQAMNEVNRPDQEGFWQEFTSSKRIAWKTGTSFGNRDAWAIGITPAYLVGVWAGNANGEGRPSITGLGAAAPLMFDVFRLLHSDMWFLPPYDDMVRMAVCRLSGHKASHLCNSVDTVWVPQQGEQTSQCPYHRMVHLNPEGNARVNSSCMPVSQIRHEVFFILPPVEEYFFKQKNAFYKSLPDYLPSCLSEPENSGNMAIIYPDRSGKVILPKGLTGLRNKVILKAVHRNPAAELFWYLDDSYLGSTQLFHHMAVAPAPGECQLTISDNNGNFISRKLVIIVPD